MSAAAAAYPRNPQSLACVLLHGVLIDLHRALAAWTRGSPGVSLHHTRSRDLDGVLRGAARLQTLQSAHLEIEAFWCLLALHDRDRAPPDAGKLAQK